MRRDLTEPDHVSGTHGNHPLEGAVRVEELVGSMPQIGDDERTVRHRGEGRRHSKFAGPFSCLAHGANEGAPGIHDRHLRGLPVQNKEVPCRIEGEAGDLTEGLPQVAVEGAHPVDLFEIRAQSTVVGRKLDRRLAVCVLTVHPQSDQRDPHACPLSNPHLNSPPDDLCCCTRSVDVRGSTKRWLQATGVSTTETTCPRSLV